MTVSLASWWDHSLFGIPIARDVFIETGCKSGDTLWEAKDHFTFCDSIEINATAHAHCEDRFRNFPRVNVHLGDSRNVLPRIIDPRLATTFYLDAHCEGLPSTVPEADTECPLLDEVLLILAADWKVRPIIVIDDIHMLKPEYWNDPSTNRALFTPADWPRFEEVADLLSDYRYTEDAENRLGLWG